MTVQLIPSITGYFTTGAPKNYTGSSLDIKPVVDIPVGSTFFEIDTGSKFTFLNGSWVNLSKAAPLGQFSEGVDLTKDQLSQYYFETMIGLLEQILEAIEDLGDE